MGRFEEILVGDTAEISHIVNQEDIDKFVSLTGDDNKLHVNTDYASKTSFKKPVVHGMLSASFISTIIGTKLPGDGALWFAQNLEFLTPVRIGDTIIVKAEVIKKIPRLKAIEIKTDIYNQNKQKVITGTAKIKLIDQDIIEKKDEPEKLNKIALVVGGTGGIGKAICLQLAKDGFNVAVHYKTNEKKAKEISEAILKIGKMAMIVKADINIDEQVKEMIHKIKRKLGDITVLVNSTTIKIANIEFSRLDWNDIQNHFDINIKGSFNLIKNVLPMMESNKYGKIIGITTQAIETVNSEWLHYITAKSALHGFLRALALELAPKGVRVNMVSPGMAETELIADISEKARLLTATKTPLKRLTLPEDVASAVSFLASDNSNFITGETIRVNGGQVML